MQKGFPAKLLKASYVQVKNIVYSSSKFGQKSQRYFKTIKNKHSGKCIILCNGPSLLDTNFDILEKYFCIGLNKISLMQQKKDFSPDVIACVNPYVIEQFQSSFRKIEIPTYLDFKSSKKFQLSKANHIYGLLTNSEIIPDFSTNICNGVTQGCTVTYVAMQLAFHYGFRDVALVGCDHYFHNRGNPNELVTQDGHDRNHFDPNYFPSGSSWQLPDLDESEISYTRARRIFNLAGGRIVNCSVKTSLNIFPKMTLEKWSENQL